MSVHSITANMGRYRRYKDPQRVPPCSATQSTVHPFFAQEPLVQSFVHLPIQNSSKSTYFLPPHSFSMRGLFVASAIILASLGGVTTAPVPGNLKPSDFPSILSDLTVPASSTQNVTSSTPTPSSSGSNPFGSGSSATGAMKRAVVQLYEDIMHPRTVQVGNAQVELPVEVRSILNEAAAQ